MSLSLKSLIVSTLFIVSATTAFANNQPGSSLFETAKSFHDGQGVQQDFQKAHELYLKAVSQGNTDAMLNLGYMYFVGEGVDQNFVEARQWYKKAASLGNSDANTNLAMMDMRKLGLASIRSKPTKIVTPLSQETRTDVQSDKPASIPLDDLVQKKQASRNIDLSHVEPTDVMEINAFDLQMNADIKPTLASFKPMQTGRIIVPGGRTIKLQTAVQPKGATIPTIKLAETQLGGIAMENVKAQFSANKTSMTLTAQIRNLTGKEKSLPEVTLSVKDTQGITLKSWPLTVRENSIAPFDVVSVHQTFSSLPPKAKTLKYKIEKPRKIWNTLIAIGLAGIPLLLLLLGTNWLKLRNRSDVLFVI